MKIVAAFDSFKGCLTSQEAATAAAEAIRKLDANAEVITVEVADGGEGMTEAIFSDGIGKKFDVHTHDPLMRPIKTTYIIDGCRAYMAMSAAAGITLLSEEEKNPMKTTTFGVGKMISDALRYTNEIYIGLGGSATNDCGLGAIQALGAKFFDKTGEFISEPITGSMLKNIGFIDISSLDRRLGDINLYLMCDVDNPMLGERGGTAIFSRQKGATPETMSELEAGSRNVAEILKKLGFSNINSIPGGGAAGNMGATFATLLKGKILRGGETLLDIIDFEKKCEGADLILTGEGKSDLQTLAGKLPCCILKKAQKKGIPTLLLAGDVSDREALKNIGFTDIICINEPYSDSSENPLNPEVAACRLGESVAALLKSGLYDF